MAGLTYDQDGLSTILNADFLSNAKFKSAMVRAVQSHHHYPIEWRIHVVTWAAQHCMNIAGDFVECGVNRGFTSSAVLHYVDWNKTHGNRTFYLMDTFHGLVEGQVNESERALGRVETFKNLYPECYEITKKNFSEYNGVVLIRGAIPETLSQNPSTSVAFIHIDMNCAAPEVAAIRHFWPIMTPGGLIVLDDYAYQGYQPQKDAIDALGLELGFMVLSIPTGGGLIVKPPSEDRSRWWHFGQRPSRAARPA